MTETTRYDFGHLTRTEAGLGRMFARPKAMAAGCILIVVGLGWFYLALLSAASGEAFNGSWIATMQALCRAFPDESWSLGAAAVIALMWSAMTLAMMLPSATPMILTYAEIAETAARKGEKIVTPLVIAAGYASVWIGFSLAATIVQILLTRAALLDTGVVAASALFAGAIFVGAGIYQFSAFKHACLTRCQHPFPFFFANWTTTSRGVFRLGVIQGLYCLGCCWAMMLVMFAVGVMNVVWMAGLAAVMTIEKLQSGRRFTHAVGAVLLVVGAGFITASFYAHWR